MLFGGASQEELDDAVKANMIKFLSNPIARLAKRLTLSAAKIQQGPEEGYGDLDAGAGRLEKPKDSEFATPEDDGEPNFA